MEAAFQVLKARPKIPVVLTSDSVCAGDDCDAPHEKTVEVYSFVDPEALTREISSGYLPSVAGVGHSWTCVLNGVRMAEITSSGIRALVRESPFSDENRAYRRSLQRMVRVMGHLNTTFLLQSTRLVAAVAELGSLGLWMPDLLRPFYCQWLHRTDSSDAIELVTGLS